jgi:hypothetical protein
VVELLEAARAPAELRCPSAEDQHRRGVEESAGQAGDAVGDAGPGGEHGQTGAALELGHRLGGEHGRLLVAYVVDRQPGPVEGVVERKNVPAGQREHLAYAEGPQRGEREIAAVPFRHVAS